jgi:lipid II:glycine glycyltransferase (peptidoglycan interpeptide bridge formation enzyme)
MPYINREILRKVYKNKAGRIFYVKFGDRVICITFIVVYDDKAYILLLGSNKEAYDLRAPALCWFNTIETLKAEGFKYVNLGGIPKDSSKSKMIFTKTSYGAEKHVCSGGNTPHLNGRLYNLLNVVYAKMPDINIKKIIKKSLSGRC